MELYQQHPLYIYNTLSRTKEVFEPIHPGKVGMYVCGPTVYGEPHLGNARGAVNFDVVFRLLQYLGYKVRYVRNITDVGHLEDEVAGTGEDKIAKKARLEELEPMEVVQYYTKKYHKVIQQLNCLDPSIEPSATAHIMEQIRLVQEIMDNGYAYESGGNVYFNMEAYTKSNTYGKLSGKQLDELISSSRALDGQDEKKSPNDFALWKKAKPEHIMRWSSPWSDGFPGWHLECTAMSQKYLGLPFDIHGGGMDLQFPHHEGEIAQSVAACGCQPVNYWMHNNMLTVDGQKMAKSKGNFITLNEMFTGEHPLLERAYHPMTVRFFMLQSHYGSEIDFSNEALQAAEKGFNRLIKAAEVVAKLDLSKASKTAAPNDQQITDVMKECMGFLCDDFNTARALASLFDLSSLVNALENGQKEIQDYSQEALTELKSFYNSILSEVLGLAKEESSNTQALDAAMNLIIDLRAKARSAKDWATADQIRDALSKAGIAIKDGKDGTTYQVD